MSGPPESDQDLLVERVLTAVADHDRPVLQQLLHPYLHWTLDGVTTRGRNRVLALLDTTGRSGARRPPTSVELRDGQVYRWTVEEGIAG